MLFDAYYNRAEQTVFVSGIVDDQEKTVKFHVKDMNEHSAAWFVNQMLSLGDGEVLE